MNKDQDWDLLKATQESLREHMARVKELERGWVGLTDEERNWIRDGNRGAAAIIRVTEAKLREKNTYVKKPVAVEATQWFENGDHPLDYATAQDAFQNGRLASIPGSHRQAHGWVGLTDEEIQVISDDIERSEFFDIVIPYARAIEGKLKEKNA